MTSSTVHIIESRFNVPTKEAKELKDQLVKRGVKVYLELNDGYKRVDLALPEAKLNIEVDGLHHLTDPLQIVKDLSRGYYSSKRGYHTMHIPNEMLRNHMKDIADGLAGAAKISKERIHVHVRHMKNENPQ